MSGNHLLAALPHDAVTALLHAGEVVQLPPAAVVQQGGEPVERVHFPLDGVLAVQAVAGGNPVAVAMVGREGAVGLPSAVGEGPRLRAVTAGRARVLSVGTDAVRAVLAQPASPLGAATAAYTNALVAQLAQHAACARLHGLAHRVGNWLELAADRTDEPLPVEVLAGLLAVDREQLAALLRDLQAVGAVEVAGDRVAVTSRERLADASCGCAALLSVATPASLPGRTSAGPTARQRAWLRALAGGAPVTALAAQEGLALRDVYAELAAVYAGLGVTTRSAAVLVAARRGWLTGTEGAR